MNNFEVGDYVVYINGDKCELGQIKSVKSSGAFVFYHEGDTASLTPFGYLHKVCNSYVIKKTTLGGNNEET